MNPKSPTNLIYQTVSCYVATSPQDARQNATTVKSFPFSTMNINPARMNKLFSACAMEYKYEEMIRGTVPRATTRTDIIMIS
jgi:hypothetical protein